MLGAQFHLVDLILFWSFVNSRNGATQICDSLMEDNKPKIVSRLVDGFAKYFSKVFTPSSQRNLDSPPNVNGIVNRVNLTESEIVHCLLYIHSKISLHLILTPLLLS